MGEKVPLIARAVGGKVLGPRPGRAILTFWQGVLEIILRVIVVVFSLAVLVSACLALADADNGASSDTKAAMRVSSGLVVGVAVLALVLQLAFTALRFANVGILNYKIKWFLIFDSVLSFLLCVLFLAAAAASAFASHKHKDTNATIFHSLAVAAGLCCLLLIFLVILGVWSILFMLNKWNKHVVVYTLKDAVLS